MSTRPIPSTTNGPATRQAGMGNTPTTVYQYTVRHTARDGRMARMDRREGFAMLLAKSICICATLKKTGKDLYKGRFFPPRSKRGQPFFMSQASLALTPSKEKNRIETISGFTFRRLHP